MSTEPPGNGSDTASDTFERLEALGWLLLRWWGVIFRALFILAVGVIGYFWIDPQSIRDMPLSQLTLKQISENIFSVLLIIGCVRWFFELPEQRSDQKPEENPYVTWGKFGAWAVVTALLVVYWFQKKL